MSTENILHRFLRYLILLVGYLKIRSFCELLIYRQSIVLIFKTTMLLSGRGYSCSMEC